ncbi:hypothetical protein SAMN05192558_10489 [Actinokineospora alba]|uniref:ATP/GTP-binding protein n=2 Tax=Actinokineospora alba TaxID=504798 RepID=A0A1H0LCG4_9PSEU|nr:hypothetical protein C8E96_2808 [Actinokineospora alba]SDJ02072.1 hypothetical protein SAMN05421871_109208 [Actinokineospora alba]SDO65736.1 hypothetical protein SAMN05192558_10489 [Actinokineospora alba]
MLRLRSVSIVTGLVVVGGICGVAPAFADGGYGNTTCNQMPAPVCDLGAGKGGGDSKPGNTAGKGNQVPDRPGSGDSGNGQRGTGDVIIGGDSNLASCSYVKSDYQPPSDGVVTIAFTKPLDTGGGVQPAVFTRPVAGGVVAARAAAQPVPGQPGAWYLWKCSTAGVADGLFRPPVWIADGQQPGAALLPSPAELAAMARKQLRLPTPTIAANPAADQLVNLPTWMWLSSGWGLVSATAAVPGVSVTAVARPTSVTWAMGDGGTVTCSGAGTAFRSGTDPKSPSPDCGHTYRHSSAGQPGQKYPVAARVHWTVNWSGAGQSGTFPDLTTTGNAAFTVAESQALNNGGG